MNTDNFLDSRAYQRHLAEVLQNISNSVYVRMHYLQHLLDWAKDTPLPAARSIRPTFAKYLEEHEPPFTHHTRVNICKTVRHFYRWALAERPAYRDVPMWWINTLRPAKNKQAMPRRRVYWTIDEVRKIAALDAGTLTEQREQAAILFMFLSGMRIGAFVTMPIEAVDLEARTVKQWPGLGVHTKNSKAATTHLLNIPDLLDVVGKWDRLVRRQLDPAHPWYAVIESKQFGVKEDFAPDAEPGEWRHQRLRKALHDLCERAGLEYKRPHDLRHGHAMWSLNRAKTIADLKAISQNLMHSGLRVTDEVYGVLSSAQVGERIAALNARPGAHNDLIGQLKAFVGQLEAQQAGGPGYAR